MESPRAETVDVSKGGMKGQGKGKGIRGKRTKIGIFCILYSLSPCLLLSFFDKLRLQLHRTDTVDLAIDIVVTVDQANISDLCADFDDQ